MAKRYTYKINWIKEDEGAKDLIKNICENYTNITIGMSTCFDNNKYHIEMSFF